MTAHFDPLEYAQQLETAGVPKAQAEVHARTLGHVIDDCVAVPADLSALKGELTHQIEEMELRLRAELLKLESSLRAEIQGVEARLNIRFCALEKEIAALRAEMKFHRWATGATFVLLAGIYIQLLLR